jgi:hypothetical protein
VTAAAGTAVCCHCTANGIQVGTAISPLLAVSACGPGPGPASRPTAWERAAGSLRAAPAPALALGRVPEPASRGRLVAGARRPGLALAPRARAGGQHAHPQRGGKTARPPKGRRRLIGGGLSPRSPPCPARPGVSPLQACLAEAPKTASGRSKKIPPVRLLQGQWPQTRNCAKKDAAAQHRRRPPGVTWL